MWLRVTMNHTPGTNNWYFWNKFRPNMRLFSLGLQYRCIFSYVQFLPTVSVEAPPPYTRVSILTVIYQVTMPWKKCIPKNLLAGLAAPPVFSVWSHLVRRRQPWWNVKPSNQSYFPSRWCPKIDYSWNSLEIKLSQIFTKNDADL